VCEDLLGIFFEFEAEAGPFFRGLFGVLTVFFHVIEVPQSPLMVLVADRAIETPSVL
jgi:hypothetical protein